MRMRRFFVRLVVLASVVLMIMAYFELLVVLFFRGSPIYVSTFAGLFGSLLGFAVYGLYAGFVIIFFYWYVLIKRPWIWKLLVKKKEPGGDEC